MPRKVKYSGKKRRSLRVREASNNSYRPVNCVIEGDCGVELTKLPSDSVDLVFTSPPYADSRKKTYGGIAPDRYAEWLLPITAELLRVLKPIGSFVLNES
jgi:DNA modification methylase